MCIQCDFQNCSTAFHVRCAMRKELIKSYDDMDDQREDDDDNECYVFCEKCNEMGKKKLKAYGKSGIASFEVKKSNGKMKKKSRMTI